MKYFLVLGVLFTQLASASLISEGGKKYSYNENRDTWNYVSNDCSVEILSAKIITYLGWDYIEYELKYKNLGKRLIKKEKVKLLIATKSETEKYTYFLGGLTLAVENKSVEDLLNLKTSIASAEVSETTFFAGHYGGPTYKYKHRCSFID